VRGGRRSIGRGGGGGRPEAPPPPPPPPPPPAPAPPPHGHGARVIAATSDGEVDVLARAELREQLRWLARLTPSGVPLASALDRLAPDDLRGVETLLLVAPAWLDLDTDDVARAAAGLEDRVARVTCLVVAVDEDPGPVVRLSDALGARGLETRSWAVDGELADSLSVETPR
jgi:hypothetical protein